MSSFGVRYQDSDGTALTTSELGLLPYEVLITTSIADLASDPDTRTALADILTQPNTSISQVYGYVSLTGIFGNSDPLEAIAPEDRYLYVQAAPGVLEVWRTDYWQAAVQEALADEILRVLESGATGIFLDEVDIYYDLGVIGSRLNDDLGGTQASNPLLNSALVTMQSIISLTDLIPSVDIIANVDPFMLSGVIRNGVLGGNSYEALIDTFCDRVGGVLIENYLYRQSQLNSQGAADMLAGMRAWAAEGVTVYVSADFDMSETLSSGPFVFSEARVLDFYSAMAIEGFIPTANAFDAVNQVVSQLDRFDSDLPVFNLATEKADVLALYGEVSGTLASLAGDDVLIGRRGNDTLIGGTGSDKMIGGAGNDLYIVDVIGDQVFETTTTTSVIDAGGIDTVRSAVTFNLSANTGLSFVERLTLTGTGNVNATGNELANVLVGNLGNNVLNGGNGNDKLNGGAGNDRMLGGAGNDTYVVDSISDRVFETTTLSNLIDAGGNDTVQSAVSLNLDGYTGVRFVERLQLTGTANINGTGNALANTLTGNAGDNVLNGGIGRDTLNGGAGNDILIGGTDADKFVFNDVFGSDIVKGFDRLQVGEVIDISAIAEIVDFSDLVANHLTQSGANAVITVGTNTIKLTGVFANSLLAEDFLF